MMTIPVTIFYNTFYIKQNNNNYYYNIIGVWKKIIQKIKKLTP